MWAWKPTRLSVQRDISARYEKTICTIEYCSVVFFWLIYHNRHNSCPSWLNIFYVRSCYVAGITDWFRKVWLALLSKHSNNRALIDFLSSIVWVSSFIDFFSKSIYILRINSILKLISKNIAWCVIRKLIVYTLNCHHYIVIPVPRQIVVEHYYLRSQSIELYTTLVSTYKTLKVMLTIRKSFKLIF